LDYAAVTIIEDQWAHLQKALPGGVCDSSRRDAASTLLTGVYFICQPSVELAIGVDNDPPAAVVGRDPDVRRRAGRCGASVGSSSCPSNSDAEPARSATRS
jgi:hypothetical protein